MKKVKDKSKFALILMSIALVLSMSVTITLAAFAANKSGSVTLTFADGLTMRLDPKGASSGWNPITAADEDATTFSYPVRSGCTTNMRYDGIVATLNKAGYVAYKIQIVETTSGAAAVTGTWGYQSGSDKRWNFYPTGTNIDWRFTIFVHTNEEYNFVGNGPTFTATCNNIWTGEGLTQDLFQSWEFAGRTNWQYINELAGRSFQVLFTIKARTDAAPTF